ncbi:PHA/PHB synthase family protein [Allorhizocola rhizosphaerae]|uniref:PHA/PHB synthase family protein n=1 Tax=Allorhizocola rhizosphaerae TaxID=1872709 RepID=UPI0013C35B0A|nr:alpha/beta fold hydrolase [Allorhizocola rhizosphaerae]
MRLANGEQPKPAGDPGAEDERFSDPAWQTNPYFYLLRNGYLSWCTLLKELVDAAELHGHQRHRADVALRTLSNALAPTNLLLGNPEALRRASATHGISMIHGLRNLCGDIVQNRGRPRQVDTSAFELGHNLAATPGTVVYRNQIMELIQYDPQTEQVYEIPLLFSPQWINKYYVADLAPGRSLIEWAVRHGHTVFAISYRDPGPESRHLSLNDYLDQGLLRALDVVEDVTASRKTNLMGACNGGTLALMLAAWLAHGRRQRIGCLTLLNSTAVFDDLGVLGAFRDEALMRRFARLADERGYLDGGYLADLFDVLRPTDLVWNYLARGWLMGESPPSFDVLAWSADYIGVPAALHNDFVRDLCLENRLARGAMVVAHRRLDLSRVTQDLFAVAAARDHLIGWQSAYRTAKLLGGKAHFALTPGGHVTGVIRPPSPKAFHHHGLVRAADPEIWRSRAARRQGSWWESWAEWLAKRAGVTRTPPPTGSGLYPPGAAAPGSYVR